jgi:para-nitrobenzyl esterase
MFFVHGGGNTSGSASARTLDGQYLAGHEGVVVVNVSYRLGLLGFLAAPALDAESPQHVSGNYALLDQIAALQWVHRNAAAFGGNPERVLLFGESGGARDTCMLFASALSKGLFSAALMESGNCEETRFLDKITTLEATEDRYAPIVAALRCSTARDVAACLRAVTIDQLVGVVQAGLGAGWEPLPNVDGHVLPDLPMQLFRTGQHPNHVPFAIGTNADEFALKGLVAPPIPDASAYQTRIANLFGAANAPSILEEYPAANYPSPTDAFVALWSDQHFTCPARRYARAIAGGQTEGVYRYFFTHAIQSNPSGKGAVHGSELLFVFHNFGAIVPTVAESQLAIDIEGYWGRFAAAGNPNGQGALSWPRYGAGDDYLHLDLPMGPDRGVHTSLCDFWDGLAL